MGNVDSKEKITKVDIDPLVAKLALRTSELNLNELLFDPQKCNSLVFNESEYLYQLSKESKIDPNDFKGLFKEGYFVASDNQIQKLHFFFDTENKFTQNKKIDVTRSVCVKTVQFYLKLIRLFNVIIFSLSSTQSKGIPLAIDSSPKYVDVTLDQYNRFADDDDYNQVMHNIPSSPKIDTILSQAVLPPTTQNKNQSSGLVDSIYTHPTDYDATQDDTQDNTDDNQNNTKNDENADDDDDDDDDDNDDDDDEDDEDEENDDEEEADENEEINNAKEKNMMNGGIYKTTVGGAKKRSGKSKDIIGKIGKMGKNG